MWPLELLAVQSGLRHEGVVRAGPEGGREIHLVNYMRDGDGVHFDLLLQPGELDEFDCMQYRDLRTACVERGLACGKLSAGKMREALRLAKGGGGAAGRDKNSSASSSNWGKNTTSAYYLWLRLQQWQHPGQ